MNEMTVLSVFEVSQRIFFQRSTNARYRLRHQKFKLSRGQHATNEAVEPLDAGLSVTFFNDPLLHPRSKLPQK